MISNLDSVFVQGQQDQSDQFWQAVSNYCLLRVKDEDLAQDILLKVFANLPSITSSQPFSHWLNKIISNTIVDSHRKAKRCPVQVPFDETIHAYPESHSGLLTVDLTGVTGIEREIADMLILGFTIADAAKQLGLSPATARKKLERLRRNK